MSFVVYRRQDQRKALVGVLHDAIAAATNGLQAFGNGDQQVAAGVVTHGRVDPPQVVDFHEHEPDFLIVGSGCLQVMLEHGHECREAGLARRAPHRKNSCGSMP